MRQLEGTTTAAPTYTLPNNPSYVVLADDQCSEKIDLLEPVTLFGQVVESIFMCANGYLSLGGDNPETLVEPDDLYNLQTNAVIAPLLARQGANYAGQFSQGLGFFESENGFYEGTILAADPFFNDDYQFIAYWGTLHGTGPENWMRVIFVKDNNYAGTGNQKVLLYVQYGTAPINQDSSSGQYVRAGINSPNNG